MNVILAGYGCRPVLYNDYSYYWSTGSAVLSGVYTERRCRDCSFATFIILSTCNSRDTLLSDGLIYRFGGHYVQHKKLQGLIRAISALAQEGLIRRV